MYDFKEILAKSKYDFPTIGLPGQSDYDIEAHLFEIIKEMLSDLVLLPLTSPHILNDSRLFDIVIHLQYAIIWLCSLSIGHSPQHMMELFEQCKHKVQVQFFILNFVKSLENFYISTINSTNVQKLQTEIRKTLAGLCEITVDFSSVPMASKRVSLTNLFGFKEKVSSSLFVQSIEMCKDKGDSRWRFMKHFIYVYNLVICEAVFFSGMKIKQNFLGFSCLDIFSKLSAEVSSLAGYLGRDSNADSILSSLKFPVQTLLVPFSVKTAVPVITTAMWSRTLPPLPPLPVGTKPKHLLKTISDDADPAYAELSFASENFPTPKQNTHGTEDVSAGPATPSKEIEPTYSEPNKTPVVNIPPPPPGAPPTRALRPPMPLPRPDKSVSAPTLTVPASLPAPAPKPVLPPKPKHLKPK